MSRVGRPSAGTAPESTPFGASVIAALEARQSRLAAGPRTLAELARLIDVDPAVVQRGFRGRALPASVRAAILAALPELIAPPEHVAELPGPDAAA